MVRVCAVEGCLSSDLTHLAHRFPKDAARAREWQEALALQGKDVEMLMEKHTVCTLHFEKKDYRNIESRHLNKTALPKLVTSFWSPPLKDKTFEIAIEMKDAARDKNALHVNIIDHKSMTIEEIEQEQADEQQELEEFDEEDEAVYEAMNDGKSVDVVRKLKSNERGEYYIVVEEEEDLGDEPKSQKRRNLDISSQKSKKQCAVAERHEIPEESVLIDDEETEDYDFEERVYHDAKTQTEDDLEDVDEELLCSGYWQYSKEELIRMLLKKDEKCIELEKKVLDFKQAKEKMLQSIEMLKMM
ncbi:G1/S-specific cyclin-E-like [Phlebotomus argentipes]|uniref:G1/S-specific cyclin-E-like n=1 Tax=Phlebotomus argentipes TaxID=94469 RepID=UPI002892F33E|nr:G1/S-specific cyclin-E-like [Phlebotomus argentipes]XP_059621924.1 G1/S-specific cyclin-E-like [Phlebotomus argentipes]